MATNNASGKRKFARLQILQGDSICFNTKNPVLLSGELAYEKDTSKIKIGDGITKWNELEYLVDPDLTVKIENHINQEHVILVDGKIPSKYLPGLTAIIIVKDIDERDGLKIVREILDGQVVHVIDASKDTTVTKGSATYIWTGDIWDKISEFESLDFDIKSFQVEIDQFIREYIINNLIEIINNEIDLKKIDVTKLDISNLDIEINKLINQYITTNIKTITEKIDINDFNTGINAIIKQYIIDNPPDFNTIINQYIINNLIDIINNKIDLTQIDVSKIDVTKFNVKNFNIKQFEGGIKDIIINNLIEIINKNIDLTQIDVSKIDVTDFNFNNFDIKKFKDSIIDIIINNFIEIINKNIDLTQIDVSQIDVTKFDFNNFDINTFKTDIISIIKQYINENPPDFDSIIKQYINNNINDITNYNNVSAAGAIMEGDIIFGGECSEMDW